MVLVTRLDKQEMYINPDQIVSIEETPDTVLTLFNGNHFIVKERASVIISRIVAFRSRIIKRSALRTPGKGVARDRKSQFQQVKHSREIPAHREYSEKAGIPFHSKDN